MMQDKVIKRKKHNIFRRIMAVIVTAGLLFNMDGMNGIGIMTAEAASTSYPDEATPGDSCDVNDDTQFAFYMYYTQAENEVENFEGSGTAVSGAGKIFEVGEGNTFTFPSSVDGIPEVGTWVKVNSNTVGGVTRVSYIPKYQMEITYNPNFSGVSVITDRKDVHDHEMLELRGEGTFEREGYKLLGWGNEPDGGVVFGLGDGYLADSSVDSETFYAIWEELPHVSVTYRANGGTGSDISKNHQCEWETGHDFKSFNLLDSADFTRKGYELYGWKNTTSNVEFELGENCVISAGENGPLVFDAIWVRKPEVEMTIQYRPGTGSGDVITQNKTVPLSETDGSAEITLLDKADFEKAGYDLKGWSDGSNTYDIGAKYTFTPAADEISKTIVLDAVWQRKPEIALTIQYKPGTGKGDVITQNKTVALSKTDGSAEITLLDKADFEKSDYYLKGWSVGNRTYDLGAKYSFTPADDEISKTLTFDAVWAEKKKGDVDITIKTPVYVGAEVKYDIEKNSDGEVTVEFKKKSADDSTYSKTVPLEGGKYVARAKLKETDDYKADEDTAEFEIVYLDKPISPYTYKEVTNSEGTVTDLTIVPVGGYTISTSPDSSFGTSVLYSAAKKAGGIYLRRGEDKAITGMISLTDYTVKDEPDIIFPDEIIYGLPFEATGSSKSPAALTVSYKKSDEPDSAYSTKVPTNPGKYTARITAPATGFYKAVDFKKDFTIEYLKAPATRASIDGEKGDNGWYTSDVKIKAPSGYKISKSPTGTFSDSINWSDDIDKLYYKRSDGAITDAVDCSFDVKIDKNAPSVKFADEGLSVDASTGSIKVYLDEMKFTIEDDHLASVTVGEKSYIVSNGKCEIDLPAGDEEQTLRVVATDLAGNSYSFTITISPQWRKDNKVPSGRKITLSANIPYKFDGGSAWMVEGDKTEYNGNCTFFVKSKKSYTFIQKDN